MTNDAPLDLQQLGRLHVPDVWYTGGDANPAIYVTIAGKTFTRNVDYSVVVTNNSNIGKANVTIAGKGAYKGSLSTTFDIVDPAAGLPEGGYEFVSALDSGKVIDIHGGSKDPGDIAQLYSANETSAQQFQVERASDGYYTIKNIGSGLYLSSSALMELGNKIQISQEFFDGTNRQKWMIKSQGDGYVISSAWDSRCVLDVKDGSNVNGTWIQIWNDNGSAAQRWKPRRITTARDCLDALASKNRAALSDGVYQVASAKSGSAVLDVADGSKADKAPVQLFGSNGTDAQRWRVSHDEKGYVTLTGVGSGKALDVLGGASSAGAGCGVFSPNGTWAQKWVAVRDGSSVKVTYNILRTLTAE